MFEETIFEQIVIINTNIKLATVRLINTLNYKDTDKIEKNDLIGLWFLLSVLKSNNETKSNCGLRFQKM